MSSVSWRDRACSALQRAQEEYQDLVRSVESAHSSSKIVSQSQRVAEYSLKAILYSYDIRVEKTHELHEVAKRWRGALVDIWPELEGLLEHYGWLYPERLVADYQHADVAASPSHPGISSPAVPEDSVSRAMEAARRFKELAGRVVGP